MKTTRLGLGFLYQNQAQREILINENFNKLDNLLCNFIESRSELAPPANPIDGMLYIIPNSTEKKWQADAGVLAYYSNTSWYYFQPTRGMTYWVFTEKIFVYYDGNDWLTA